MPTHRKFRAEHGRNVDRSIGDALARWQDASTVPRRNALALRSPLAVRGDEAQRPLRELTLTFGRLAVWLWAGLRFYAGIAADKLMRRDNVTRRAGRLRAIFEGLGPTFIKVAQQLAMRADLLPPEYCQELSLMLDVVPPFPTAYAQAAIERATGTPLTTIFEEFSSEPIGSASLACVYKARLCSGETVAVKVRRPGIGPRLARDARALGWLLHLAEWLGVFRPRFTKMMRVEFERMLLEEVDFLREARNTELFRMDAARMKLDFVTAPRVHFELCSHDILVTEFIDGVFLNTIVRALDSGDEAELQRVSGQGIDLHEIAHRLIMAAHWALLEGLLFHADPHPANICVQPGNRIVFVDLASCGRLTGKYRRIWQRYHREFAAHNVQAMVSAAVAMLEPLPPIDLVSFSREIELIFWDWVYAINSDHSAWWEQASGMIWIKFADAARRYQVPMSAELVRIFRATFIYDTTVFRLWERIDMLAEFRSYQHQAGRRVRRRVRRALRARITHGLTDTDYIDIVDLWHMGQQFVGRLQHDLDIPLPDFAREIGKVSYAVLMLLRLVALGLAIYMAAAVASAGVALFTGRQVNVASTLAAVAGSRWFLVPLAGLALLSTGKVIRKLGEYAPLGKAENT